MALFLNPPHRHAGRCQGAGTATRRCRFEQMEPRQLLAADLAVASVGGPLIQPGGSTAAISGNVYSTEAVASCESHRAGNPLAGVPVQLLDATGVLLEEGLTDEQGAYRFSDLTPGQYALRQSTPEGFSAGTAHVGAGGGIALDANYVSEILVLAGEKLLGYDFCDSATAAEPVEAVAPVAAPYWRLLLQPTATAKSKPVQELLLATPVAEPLTDLAPPLVSQRSEIYGGSSRSLQPAESISDWGDDPFDSWLSIASYWELAAAHQTACDALEPILFRPQASGQTPMEKQERSAEAANATDDWQTETRVELDRSEVTYAPTSNPAEASAAFPSDPQVARRLDKPAAEPRLPAATGQPELSPAKS